MFIACGQSMEKLYYYLLDQKQAPSQQESEFHWIDAEGRFENEMDGRLNEIEKRLAKTYPGILGAGPRYL
jgi:hypothetical protein